MTQFLIALLLLSTSVADAQNAAPKVLFAVPPVIVKGEATKLVLRGTQLEKTKSLKLVGVEPDIALTPKPGKAAVPNGYDAAKVGDQHVECEFTLPENSKTELVEFLLEIESGEKASFKVPVLERAKVIDDKEPNKGFAQAQPLAIGQHARGTIHEPRDVDVYRVEVKAGQKIAFELFAERLGTPLDGSLTLYDERSRLIDSNDDRVGRDSQFEVTPSRDGVLFLVVFDANDAGSNLHGYLLKVTATK